MQYIEAKSILSRLKGPDTWFGITYNMNLYRGCQHGCIYCDTRSDCYKIGDISQISVKQNALELLKKELYAKRKNKATIGTGSMNDPYMPVEKELQFVRKALQLIATEKFPVHILTKSSLVERDSDILQEIAKIYVAASFTITSATDTLSSQIEPLAPKTSERFKAMELLAHKGIYTGVTLMPILPFINDTKENIQTIIHRAKDSGASYILPMFCVTLRKGSREYIYSSLDKNFPGVKAEYQKHFGDQYACYSSHYRELSDVFFDFCGKLGIATQMQFYQPLPDGQLSLF